MDRVRNAERAVQLAPRCDASMSPSPLSHSLPARCMREPAHACSTTSVDAQRRIALCTTPFTGVGMGASQASKSARVTASVRALSVGSERMRRMVGAGAACAQRRKRSSFEGMACENGRSRSRCARGWAAVLASLRSALLAGAHAPSALGRFCSHSSIRAVYSSQLLDPSRPCR